jgi:hypothetical protein
MLIAGKYEIKFQTTQRFPVQAIGEAKTSLSHKEVAPCGNNRRKNILNSKHCMEGGGFGNQVQPAESSADTRNINLERKNIQCKLRTKMVTIRSLFWR